VILEITRYLSLNDAIKAFSTNILPIIRNSKRKVHISDPSDAFMKMILRKLNPEQIVSVQFNGERPCSEINLTSSTMFDNVTSMSLLNLQHADEIILYKAYFPNLTCVSLHYDNEIGLKSLNAMLGRLETRIKRLEIRCGGALCTHYDTDERNIFGMGNYSLDYFSIDISHFPVVSRNQCFQQYASCFLMMVTDFIKNMCTIRHVRLITDECYLKKLLNVNEWKSLVYVCFRLETIILRVLGSLLNNVQVEKKQLEIQEALVNVRQNILFKVVFD
jgi:hypothetical protein